jgi:hypothetical protein
MNNLGFAPGFVLFIFIQVGLSLSAPLPSQTMVNNESMQCASFLPGDECMDCVPPAGWEILGRDVPCPEGYTKVSVGGNCTDFEIERCCTERHSGASGDCRNLVKNDLTGECAFVKDASNCSLPEGWQRMPDNATSYNWLCPLDYNWTTLPSVSG